MVLLLDAPCLCVCVYLCVCVCLCVCFCVCLWLCPCAEQWRCWWRPSSGGTLTSGTSSTLGSSLLVSMFGIGDSVKPVLVIIFGLISFWLCAMPLLWSDWNWKIFDNINYWNIKEQSMGRSCGKYLVFLLKCWFSKQHPDYSNLCLAMCSSLIKAKFQKNPKYYFRPKHWGISHGLTIATNLNKVFAIF